MKKLYFIMMTIMFIGMLFIYSNIKAEDNKHYKVEYLNNDTVLVSFVNKIQSDVVYNIKVNKSNHNFEVKEMDGVYLSLNNSYLQVLMPEDVSTTELIISLR